MKGKENASKRAASHKRKAERIRIIKELRTAGLKDAQITRRFKVSEQRIGQLAGPRKTE
jgi:hypothetical protein